MDFHLGPTEQAKNGLTTIDQYNVTSRVWYG